MNTSEKTRIFAVWVVLLGQFVQLSTSPKLNKIQPLADAYRFLIVLLGCNATILAKTPSNSIRFMVSF